MPFASIGARARAAAGRASAAYGVPVEEVIDFQRYVPASPFPRRPRASPQQTGVTRAYPGIDTYGGGGTFASPIDVTITPPPIGPVDFGPVTFDIPLPGERPSGATPARTLPQCPDGYESDAEGRCVLSGARGTVQRALPGGRTGTLADVSGETVLGAMGIPAVYPTQVGSRYNLRDLGLVPILSCPRGMILGKDDLCYVKGSIPRNWRKWPPAPRPPVTAGDAKAIRTAERVKGKVKRLASASGFTCAKKGTRRSK